MFNLKAMVSAFWVFVLLVTGGSAYAQTMSGAGVGAGVDRAVTQSCDMEYRNLRTNITSLMQQVNALLACNSNGQTLSNGTCVDLPLGPAHSWQGTVLRLANPDGEWGTGYDLRGPQGDPGSNIECYTPVADSSSSGGSSSGASSSGGSSSGASSGASSSGASSSGASSSGASSSGASSGNVTSSSGGSGGCNPGPDYPCRCACTSPGPTWRCIRNAAATGPAGWYWNNTTNNRSIQCP